MMLDSFVDFANEKTQLEYICKSLGAEALITMKYYAKYAGEGIKYSWGAAKGMYHHNPLASKKGKEKFVDLVLKCTSQEVLTAEMIRKFSRHARSYMLSYKALEIIKCHWAALNFDQGFVTSTLKLAKNLDVKEEIEIGPQKKKRGQKRQHQ